MACKVHAFAKEATDPQQDAPGGKAKKQFSYREQYGVIVMCEGETAQEETYNTLKSMGYSCKVVVV